MADHLVGLDVGAGSVRVAEIDAGVTPVLRSFGEVPLPPGAVRNGEVSDPAAVAEGIRRLWQHTGLRPRAVRVAVASERVVVRTIELPSLPEAELAGALELQAQHYIPIPVEDAVLDFRVLERVSAAGGEVAARILLVAAHRETVGNLLAAVKAAGLTVNGVDIMPLALLRGLGPPGGRMGSAEGIVWVGADVTFVVVHEAGVPRLVRIVSGGSDAVVEAVAREAGLGTEEASVAVKAGDGEDDRVVRLAVEAARAGVLRPVQSSLDYYVSQPDTAPLQRVVLTGAGSHLPGLEDSLTASLGVPVARIGIRETIDTAPLGMTEDRLAEVEPHLPVLIGLALGGPAADVAAVNLLPPEARREQAARRALRRVGLAAAALLIVLAALSVVHATGNARQRARLAGQQRTNAALQAELDEMAGSLKVEEELVTAQQAVAAALAGDVAWSRILEDLGVTIPESVWLNSVRFQLTPPPTAAAAAQTPETGPGTPNDTAGTAAPPPPGGTAAFTATALDFTSVAAWLDRLPRLPYYVGLSVSSLSKSEGSGRPVVSFGSSATIGPAARSDRLARILRPEP